MNEERLMGKCDQVLLNRHGSASWRPTQAFITAIIKVINGGMEISQSGNQMIRLVFRAVQVAGCTSHSLLRRLPCPAGKHHINK